MSRDLCTEKYGQNGNKSEQDRRHINDDNVDKPNMNTGKIKDHDEIVDGTYRGLTDHEEIKIKDNDIKD